MIKELHSALAREGFELSGEELAEVLWLALRRGGHAVSPEAEGEGPSSRREVGAAEGRASAPDTAQSGDETSSSVSAPATASVVLPESPASSVGVLTFQTPGASALTAAGEFFRALRPLRQRAASAHEFEVDEDATARRILEQRLWLPVLRARKVPRYELAVVVDGAGSMAIWEQTIREFVHLLVRLGAFSDVRVWTLDTEEAGPRLRLRPGSPGHPDRMLDANTLTDPTGRRLIWLVSDGIAAAWGDGRVEQMMAVWSQQSPVALIGVLPERLWPGTALSDGERCRIRMTLRGRARIGHQVERVRRRSTGGRCSIPVAALDPRQLGTLARALVGTLVGSVPGLLVRTDRVAIIVPRPDPVEAQAGSEERVRRFDAVASPTARKLARLFAAVPLSLPVMRLIQQTALPRATHGHLAEVFLGGLIEEISEPGPRLSADDRRYEFSEGVREQLLRDSRPTESLAVLRRVSQFIVEKLGQPRDFRAEIVAAAGAGRAFAEVAAAVLLPLGGAYRELAEDLIGRGMSQRQGIVGTPEVSAKEAFRAHLKALPEEIQSEFLRPHQVEAIARIEASLKAGHPRTLVAMTTGSGKIVTVVTHCYRLIRFAQARKILVLVDQNLLAEQIRKAFDFCPIVENARFSAIYDVQRLSGNDAVAAEARVVVTTIQHVYSILSRDKARARSPESPGLIRDEGPSVPFGNPALPPGLFDAVILYDLQADNALKWKMVIDYFDASLIGFAATPTPGLLSVFADNLVMVYGTMRAVSDGYRVDWEVFKILAPPMPDPLNVEAGTQPLDQRSLARSGNLDDSERIRLILRTFRERLFAEMFPGRTHVPKTVIFARSIAQAAEIVRHVNEVFGEPASFCGLVSGSSDRRSLDDLLNSFKNDYHPRIAVTVNILAAGRDMPAVEIVMFMRAVRNPSQFAEMMSRGARTIASEALKAVTPDAEAKSRFVVVDCVGFVEERLKQINSMGVVAEHEAGRANADAAYQAELDAERQAELAEAEAEYHAELDAERQAELAEAEAEYHAELDAERQAELAEAEAEYHAELNAERQAELAEADAEYHAELDAERQAELAEAEEEHHTEVVAERRAELADADVEQAELATVRPVIANAAANDQMKLKAEDAEADAIRMLQLGNERDAASTYRQLGIVAQERGDLNAAETWYRKSLALKEKLGTDDGAASTYHQLGVVAHHRGDLDAAETLHLKSLALMEELGNEHGAASSSHQLGIVAQLRGDLDAAETRYRKSLALMEKLGNERGAAGNYHQLGMVARQRGDLDAGETLHLKSLALMEKLGNEHGAAGAYHQLGLVAQHRGDLDVAETWYLKSLSLTEKLGNDYGAAGIYHQLGIVAQHRGDLDAAETRYRKSLALTEKLGNEHGAASTYHQLGLVAQHRGDLDAAETQYLKSLAIEEKLGNEHGAAGTYGQLGALALLRGEHEVSAGWLIRCVNTFLRTHDTAAAEQGKRKFLLGESVAPAELRSRLRAMWTDAGLPPLPDLGEN